MTDLGTGPHCVFVRDYNSTTSEFTCLNSWGANNNPTPVVKSMDITHYYRLSAMASKLKLQQTSSQGATSIKTSLKNLFPFQVKTSNSVKNSTSVQQSLPTPNLTKFSKKVQKLVLSKENEDFKCLHKIQFEWEGHGEYYWPQHHEIEQASRLACSGYLTEVNSLNLWKLNLTNIPGEMMVELTKCVKEKIIIKDNSHLGQHNLKAILENARCRNLDLRDVSFNPRDTRLLVQALNSVKELELWDDTKVDIKTLTSYNGNGLCRKIELTCMNKVENWEYRRNLTIFAQDKGWEVTTNDKHVFIIQRLFRK